MSNYNSTLQSNNTDLQAILNTINELPNAGEEQATPVISVNNSNGLITATAGTKSATKQLAFQAAKTITPSTVSQIAVSSGYYTGGSITIAAVPTQSKTVTPTSTTQNITPDSGKFLSKVTVNGDSDLVAGNIKSGVNIFGVIGTYAGSGGGDTIIDSLIDKTLTSCTNDRVTLIGNYAFYDYSSLTKVSFPNVTSIGSSAFGNCFMLTTVNFPNVININNSAFGNCKKLTTISFPNATSIGSNAFINCFMLTTVNFPNVININNSAFGNCKKLTTISFPNATSIGSSAFDNCKKLTTINFPSATTIGSYAFYGCTSLTTASFPAATSIGSYAFYSCHNLKSLYLTGSSICKLSGSRTLSYTPIDGFSTYAGTYGSIYVPASLLTSYQKATNWTCFSSRFVGI